MAQPAVFDDVRAWRGPAMAQSDEWTIHLSPQEIAELDVAAEQALACGSVAVTLQKKDFPLPSLGARLRRMRADLLNGRGFALIRGWPSTERSLERTAMVFRGIGAHLGEALSQNAKGHVLGHVANLGLDYRDPTTRGYQTNAELNFHTDGGDLVGLLCVRPSKSGGRSMICSSTTVWNELVHQRPDLAAVMAQPFYFSRVGEIRPGQKRYFAAAPFQACDGRMIAILINSFIQKAQSFEEVPRLTDVQHEALAHVSRLCADDAIRLDMDFRAGDMQFLCNHSIFHSRTAYEDWPDPSQRRHLLRLWLSCADGPRLPEAITTDFQGSTASGRPDGIRIPGVPLIAPLEPC
jgi:hypothetical protein